MAKTKAENTDILSMEDVQKKIDLMLKEAEEKARRIVENAAGGKKDSLSLEEKKEIERNEEYVEVKLFKDNEKYQDDVYVAVGNQNCVIKRGIPVKIKRKFYLALCQSDEQDFKTAQLIEQESGNYKEI